MLSAHSRDKLVAIAKEIRRRPKHEHPWIYSYKVKSGRRKTSNIEHMYYNMSDLKGHAVEKHAKKNENLAVYGIIRVMRSHLLSRREDI